MTVTIKLDVMIMSGVEDGKLLRLDATNGDGELANQTWTITIGRREDCDICLRNDTYISRLHAQIHWKEERWWLQDCNSKNGTFVEDGEDDARVSGTIPLTANQPFRIGRTWLRIQPGDEQ